MLSDYHVHLHGHGPWTGEGPRPGDYPLDHIEAYIEAAAVRGVTEVGFTEHLYRCVEAVDVLGPYWEDSTAPDAAARTEAFLEHELNLSLSRYVDAVLGAKNRGLPVKLGLEVDFSPHTIHSVVELLQPYPWDFLIGSVHWIGGWGVDDPGSVAEFERRGLHAANALYYEWETQLAASGAVDVLAHVDFIKTAGVRLAHPPIDLYQPVVEAAARSGTAVEINTSGTHRPCAEIFPEPTFLEMFREAGVGITIGSDAHYPHDCGRDHDIGVRAARDAGYTHRLDFSERTSREVSLAIG